MAVKIRRLESFTTEFVSFVRVTTDTGAPGWGAAINPDWLGKAHYHVSEV